MKRVIIICILCWTCHFISAQNDIIPILQSKNAEIMSEVLTKTNYDIYLKQEFIPTIAIIPTDEALKSYIDLVSYGQTVKKMWEFKLDGQSQLNAYVYDCDENEDGTFTKQGNSVMTLSGIGNGCISNRIKDLLDNSIIMEPYSENKIFYKTRGNNFVQIERKGNSYQVYGSLQRNVGHPIIVKESIQVGTCLLLLTDEPVMGTPNSVAKTLHDTEVDGEAIFEKFFDIVDACAISPVNSKNGWRAADQTYGNLYNEKDAGMIGAEDSRTRKATYLLNNYHYTIYAPTNEAMDKAFAAGLPTLEDLEAAELYDDENDLMGTAQSRADSIREVMLDFVKYHIQDNAVFVNVETAGVFNTAKTKLIKVISLDETTDEETWNGDYTPGRPYKLSVQVKNGQMSVTDCNGTTTKVVIKEGAYNLMAREYWFTDEDSRRQFVNPNTMRLNNSSFVVIHAIEDPLIFDAENQFTYTYKPLIQE